MAEETGYTYRLASTQGGPEILFAIHPTDPERALLVQIGTTGGTLDSEDTNALIDWLQAHRAKP